MCSSSALKLCVSIYVRLCGSGVCRRACHVLYLLACFLQHLKAPSPRPMPQSATNISSEAVHKLYHSHVCILAVKGTCSRKEGECVHACVRERVRAYVRAHVPAYIGVNVQENECTNLKTQNGDKPLPALIAHPLCCHSLLSAACHCGQLRDKAQISGPATGRRTADTHCRTRAPVLPVPAGSEALQPPSSPWR